MAADYSPNSPRWSAYVAPAIPQVEQSRMLESSRVSDFRKSPPIQFEREMEDITKSRVLRISWHKEAQVHDIRYQYTPYPIKPPIIPVAANPALMKAGFIKVAKYVFNLS